MEINSPRFIQFTFECNFMFHLNLDYDNLKILTFPIFYKQLFH